eukprot:gnl/TRDRNA2_/TRDRNA2_159763_c0_seq1.p1 gnl/TRDRNA2_/TRDRNA2_159763_c0~~gnl/TRDRNA2_/TRDRNA2_159763_c0_seq1.p1  ORF type:complete len:119 (+),score=2.74 gnl/TRDRNA2_/TRDRNA2_159763_c0_seq1:173-529(+)
MQLIARGSLAVLPIGKAEQLKVTAMQLFHEAMLMPDDRVLLSAEPTSCPQCSLIESEHGPDVLPFSHAGAGHERGPSHATGIQKVVRVHAMTTLSCLLHLKLEAVDVRWCSTASPMET